MKNRFWLLVLLLIPCLAYSETRTKPLDFIVLLDKSLSMVDKIEDVKTFFKVQILDKSIQIGDSVLIILFYGKTEVLVDQNINSPEDLATIRQKLTPVIGDGRFTDIGTALDFTYEYVKTHRTDDRRRHFILLTDGRQEAPPESRYQSLDFSIKHPFLESAKNIQQSGWKVQILGVGTDTEAENLAKELSGLSQVFINSKELLAQSDLRMQESLQLVELPTIEMRSEGPYLSLNVKMQNIASPRSFVLSGLAQDTGFGLGENLLAQPFSITLDPAKGLFQHLDIPLSKTVSITSQSVGPLVMSFSGEIPLTPGRFTAVSTSIFQRILPFSFVLLFVFFGSCIILIIRNRKNLNLTEVLANTHQKAASIELPKSH